MVSVQTLPDILTILFSNVNITVLTLLRCEQVCKQYCTIIRTYDRQIWKSKLQQVLPEEYLPPLVGHESWRDLATLWWAWNRPWVPQWVEGENIEDLGINKTILRENDVVVRDLVYSHRLPQTQRNYHPYTALGVMPDGQTIVRHARGTSIDSIFEETIPRSIMNISYVSHIRTDALARYSQNPSRTYQTNDETSLDCTYIENWSTGTILHGTSARFIDLPADTHIIYIHNAHIQLLTRGDQSAQQFISLKDPSRRMKFPLRNPDGSSILSSNFNGIILALLLYNRTNLTYLTLHNINTSQIIASTVLPSDFTALNVSLSRFHAFLYSTTECRIYSLTATYLYTLPICENLSPVFTAYPKMEFDNLMLLWKRETELEGEIDQVVVFDPMRRTKRRMVHRFQDQEYEERRFRGYYFTMREFPVGEDGKRSGAPERNRVFWRGLE
ncbi:hypothetical protein HDV00_006203 [Rhizophlyctis rosea]|nr:hypothetical protein HDV00_006203 [Rhizophlyctis rosea]